MTKFVEEKIMFFKSKIILLFNYLFKNINNIDNLNKMLGAAKRPQRSVGCWRRNDKDLEIPN